MVCLGIGIVVIKISYMFNYLLFEEEFDISDVFIHDIDNGVLKFNRIWYGYS